MILLYPQNLKKYLPWIFACSWWGRWKR